MLFDSIGGQATADRLVDCLYARFEADHVIRSFFGGDLAPQRQRQKLFVAEWLGGPPRYSDSAWGRFISTTRICLSPGRSPSSGSVIFAVP